MPSRRQRFGHRRSLRSRQPLLVWREIEGVRQHVHADTCICDDCEAKREAEHWQHVGEVVGVEDDDIPPGISQE